MNPYKNIRSGRHRDRFRKFNALELRQSREDGAMEGIRDTQTQWVNNVPCCPPVRATGRNNVPGYRTYAPQAVVVVPPMVVPSASAGRHRNAAAGVRGAR